MCHQIFGTVLNVRILIKQSVNKQSKTNEQTNQRQAGLSKATQNSTGKYSLRHEPNETKVSATDESWWKVEKY